MLGDAVSSRLTHPPIARSHSLFDQTATTTSFREDTTMIEVFAGYIHGQVDAL